MDVVAQIWRVDIGRVPLFLLDAERPENSQAARWITSRLYIGDEDTRLAQYMLLGIGGVRALEAMGIEPSIVHLNEGHAAFAGLELAKREYSGQGSLGAALEVAKQAHRSSPPTRRSRRATTPTRPIRSRRCSRTWPGRSASTRRRSSASAGRTPRRRPSRSA